MDNMNQNFQANQEALKKILASQVGQPHRHQLPQDPVVPLK